MCSIGQDIMIDPVKTVDGHTYDRVNIEKWLLTSLKSPLTGLDLSSKELIPNNELKLQIFEFTKKIINNNNNNTNNTNNNNNNNNNNENEIIASLS